MYASFRTSFSQTGFQRSNIAEKTISRESINHHANRLVACYTLRERIRCTLIDHLSILTVPIRVVFVPEYVVDEDEPIVSDQYYSHPLYSDL